MKKVEMEKREKAHHSIYKNQNQIPHKNRSNKTNSVLFNNHLLNFFRIVLWNFEHLIKEKYIYNPNKIQKKKKKRNKIIKNEKNIILRMS